MDCSLGKYSPAHVCVDGDLDSLGRNICIFVIFNRKKKILESVLNFIRAIKKEGYDFVFVVNGGNVTRDCFEGDIGNNDVLITRPNLGLDFAAYQLATNWLLDRRLKIERLLYCNDSVFYLDRNDSKNIFRHLIKSNDAWIGMTENYFPRFHVTSWCFQLSSEIVSSPAFINFWKTYRPVNSYQHAIRCGEIGLSKVLLQAGYVPTIIFNASSLLKRILERHPVQNEKLLLQQLYRLPFGATPPSELNAVLMSLFLGEESNQTSNLAVLLISEMGFPFLKKKLAHQAGYSVSIILLLLEEFMTDFCPETAHEIRLRGVQNKRTFSRRAFRVA
jgi:hypothetical protein